jgi:hypothetical protein
MRMHALGGAASALLDALEDEARLERMARIIGRDAMPARQRLVLLCAQLVNECFLRQSAFSLNDRYASPSRQAVMMRLIGSFIEGSERLLDAGVAPEAIRDQPVFRRLMRMGEEIEEGDWEAFSALDRELTATIRRLINEAREGGGTSFRVRGRPRVIGVGRLSVLSRLQGSLIVGTAQRSASLPPGRQPAVRYCAETVPVREAERGHTAPCDAERRVYTPTRSELGRIHRGSRTHRTQAGTQ